MFRSLLRSTLLGACLLATSVANAQITLNLKDSDIRVLIDTVAEATGRNFVVDPRVAGKVTVVSAQPMENDELYQVFLSVLQVHGYSAIDTGSVVKIIPDANAKQDATPLVTRGGRFTGGQLVTRVLKVHNVPVNQLVPILRPLVPQQGQLAGFPPANVLVLSDRAANVERLAQIVRRIDQPGQTDIEVIQLNHASAKEVVRVISNLLAESSKTAPANAVPTLVADERINAVLLTGEPQARLKARSIIAMLDTPLERSGSAQVFYLKYANAEELQKILEGVMSSLMGQSAGKDGKDAAQSIYVAADTQNNALVINAPPDVMQTIKSLIRQLDIRRAQVLVKAIIAEVSNDLSARLGANFAVNGANTGDGPIGLSTFGSTANTLLNLAQNSANAASLPTGLLLGLGDLSSNGNQFALILEALNGDAATNVLSTPSLVTVDNHEAEIIVGTNVPFLTGSFTNAGSTNPSNPFQTIERQDVGLTLRVKPQINEGNSIKLDIEQEVSSLASSSLGASDLVTNKRKLQTSVMVDDGQVLVLGGLIDETFTDSIQKVPVLGDVPVLGGLFRYTASQKVKRNLMVFINPTIVRETAGLDRLSREKYSYLRAQQATMVPERRGVLDEHPSRFPPLEKVLDETRSEATESAATGTDAANDEEEFWPDPW